MHPTNSKAAAVQKLVPAKTKTSRIEPMYVGIKDAADFTGESEWTVKQRLRLGIYQAKKSGKRTLIVFDTVKNHAASLPPAKFAPVRERRQREVA